LVGGNLAAVVVGGTVRRRDIEHEPCRISPVQHVEVARYSPKTIYATKIILQIEGATHSVVKAIHFFATITG
jgi:hypothetical protein